MSLHKENNYHEHDENSRSALKIFAHDQHLEGMSYHTLEYIAHEKKGYSISKGKRFLQFYHRIKNDLLLHRVITNNEFTRWFSDGTFDSHQLKSFVVQFTVFSNLFIVAQLHKTINADCIESMRSSKEILVNELGVVFNMARDNHKNNDKNQLSTPEGTVEGGIFHFQAAHFEWILNFAESIGLGFSEIGKRRHGTKSTLFFCDELIRLYASEDYVTSQAASFAVENWAAAGFWKQLIKGVTIYQKKKNIALPLFFFTYHDALEAQHAKHTLDELEDIYFNREINENKFIHSGNEMLDGVEVFWNGLNDSRKTC